MHFVDKNRLVRYGLIAVAVFIAISSLVTSHYLVKDLKKEEARKMEIWAEAMRSMSSSDNMDMNLVLKVIEGNNTIPVIVLDRQGNVQTFRNLNDKLENEGDSVALLKQLALEMKEDGHVIRIYLETPDFFSDIGEESSQESLHSSGDTSSITVMPPSMDEGNDYIEICYADSLILTRLSYYPYIQLLVIVFFVIIAILALFSSLKAEQNKVWVGLSKETAHQLGTPISSLTAWTQVLHDAYPEDELIPEMEKDVKRLELIAERFSKIGSLPELKSENVCGIIQRVVDYMEHRTSNKVTLTTHFPQADVQVMLMSSLFEWVMENLCKNAVDAMSGSGTIDIFVRNDSKKVLIDVSDTGKGIQKAHFSSVFKPGFTTKKRGWGLGLSLAKRIVEEYHQGRIYVRTSELGKGTTFRIELKKP